MPDGRRVLITEYGDPDGQPLLLFHGTPLSGLAYGWFADEPGRARGVRLLCPDCPGIGSSDPLPARTLTDWADDVSALADALHVNELPVLGHSCGRPFALAVAARLSRRVRAVALVAAAGPVDNQLSRAALTGTDRRLLDLSLRRPRTASVLIRMSVLLARLAPNQALTAR